MDFRFSCSVTKTQCAKWTELGYICYHVSLILLSVYSVVFADFFVMNLILWGEGSSAAMPFGTLVAILALWFCISVPLTFIGAYFGFKKSVSKTKCCLSHKLLCVICDPRHPLLFLFFFFFFSPRPLNTLYGQIRFLVKSQTSLFTQSPFLALLWEEFYLLDVFSFSSSSYSTPSGEHE